MRGQFSPLTAPFPFHDAPTPRSAPAPSFFPTPAHRSAPAHLIFGPLRSVFRSDPAPLTCSVADPRGPVCTEVEIRLFHKAFLPDCLHALWGLGSFISRVRLLRFFFFLRASIRSKILIAINRAIKIFNNT